MTRDPQPTAALTRERGRSRPGRAVEEWAWAAWIVVIVFVSVVPAEWLFGVAPRHAWSALASAAHFLEYSILTLLLLWPAARRLPGVAPAGGSASGAGAGSDAVGGGDAGRAEMGGAARRVTGAAVIRTGATSLAIAVAVELMQWPLPYRSFDPLDLLADAAGVMVAAAMFIVGRRLHKGRRP